VGFPRHIAATDGRESHGVQDLNLVRETVTWWADAALAEKEEMV
jgi:hypothetical protein